MRDTRTARPSRGKKGGTKRGRKSRRARKPRPPAPVERIDHWYWPVKIPPPDERTRAWLTGAVIGACFLAMAIGFAAGGARGTQHVWSAVGPIVGGVLSYYYHHHPNAKRTRGSGS